MGPIELFGRENLMERIPAEVVERTWRRIGEMTPDDAPDLVGDMQNEQSLLLSYLMTVGEEEFNEEERELLLYLGIVVWQIMKAGFPPPPPVSGSVLDSVERRNLAMLDYLQSEPEQDFEHTVRTIFEHYNQTEVLKYVLESIMEDEGAAIVRDENKGLFLYFLKNVIDSLDA